MFGYVLYIAFGRYLAVTQKKKKIANIQVNLKYLPKVQFIFSQVCLITK